MSKELLEKLNQHLPSLLFILFYGLGVVYNVLQGNQFYIGLWTVLLLINLAILIKNVLKK